MAGDRRTHAVQRDLASTLRQFRTHKDANLFELLPLAIKGQECAGLKEAGRDLLRGDIAVTPEAIRL